MSLLLFFDDKNIILRQNLKRIYEKPQVLEKYIYADPLATTSTGMPSVWKNPEDGNYHMFYNGIVNGRHVTLAAISEDGIRFQPRNTAKEAGIESPICQNQLLEQRGELANVFVDHLAPKEERLKALLSVGSRSTRILENWVLTSGDGIHWKQKEGVQWHTRGAEPGAACFYNSVTEKYTIIQRPDGGVRRICLAETEDWEHFSHPELIMQPDSLDEPLAEHYGMPVFPYEDWYIGFLWIYTTEPKRMRKYWNGRISAQLTYSMNGRHFQRSLRESFFENGGMVFPSALYTAADGSLTALASAAPFEHGHFNNPGGVIVPYRLRKDGFVAMETTGGAGILCTIAMLSSGGEISVNINSPTAECTCAIYTDESEKDPENLLVRDIKSIEGYTHEDCIPFSGNSESWVPQWKNNRTFDQLKGRIVYIEVKIGSGRIYSIRGDISPMMICDISRYHRFGMLPETRGLL